jgi:hypothetical protein
MLQAQEKGPLRAENSCPDAEEDRGITEGHRISAESARNEAEQARRLGEEARETHDQHREALETCVNHDRCGASSARLSSSESSRRSV